MGLWGGSTDSRFALCLVPLQRKSEETQVLIAKVKILFRQQLKCFNGFSLFSSFIEQSSTLDSTAFRWSAMKFCTGGLVIALLDGLLKFGTSISTS